MLSVNQMIKAIEIRVCIRKLWRCRAGWGMTFVLERGVHDSLIGANSKTTPNARGDIEVIYAYFPTLEACVKAEYSYWLEGKKVHGHPDRVFAETL